MTENTNTENAMSEKAKGKLSSTSFDKGMFNSSAQQERAINDEWENFNRDEYKHKAPSECMTLFARNVLKRFSEDERRIEKEQILKILKDKISALEEFAGPETFQIDPYKLVDVEPTISKREVLKILQESSEAKKK